MKVLMSEWKLNIDKNKCFIQYVGKYFESKTYKNEDESAFKYTIEVKNWKDYNNTILIFTVYKNVKPITKKYQQNGFIMVQVRQLCYYAI